MTASPAQVPEQKPFKWGADMKNLGIAVGVATALWFIPPPSGVTVQAWHLLAVFIGTIVGIITKPLPLGAVAMLGLGASMLTKTLTFAQAFSAFASEIPCVPQAPTTCRVACNSNGSLRQERGCGWCVLWKRFFPLCGAGG